LDPGQIQQQSPADAPSNLPSGALNAADHLISRNSMSVEATLNDLSAKVTGMSSEHAMRLQYKLSEHVFTLTVVSGFASGLKQAVQTLTQNG
jgi:hypothetical protein